MALYRFEIAENGLEAREAAVLDLPDDESARRELRLAVIDLATEIADGSNQKLFEVALSRDVGPPFCRATLDIRFTSTEPLTQLHTREDDQRTG